MYCASSLTPSGAGLNFFRFSIARSTMPLFAGPLPSGRSNSTTGTRALTQCAAICAPITPAPSTATLRTTKLVIESFRLLPTGSLSVRRRSERLRRQLQQRARAGADRPDQRHGFGKQALKVEPRGGKLVTIKRIDRAAIRLDAIERNLRHARPEIRVHKMPDDPQIRDGSGADFLPVGHRLHPQVHRQPLPAITYVGQRGDELIHVRVRPVFFDELGDHLAERAQLGTVVEQDLAADQVEGLDRVGPLVDHIDTRVAHDLFPAPFG